MCIESKRLGILNTLEKKNKKVKIHNTFAGTLFLLIEFNKAF